MSDQPARPRRRWFRVLRALLILGFSGFLLGVLAVGAAYLYVADDLPPVEALRDIRLEVPLRVYTRDGRLLAEYGTRRRVPVSYAETPELMVQAFTAAEDDRFFEHPGVDWMGLVRAAWNLVSTGEKGQGGSTITMQVARNFFLSREKTYLRKITEIFLALKMERELSKQEILELYLNKIFLGQRAYGVGAAAEVYFGKRVQELSLPEIALLAGLPQAPSRDNPISCPECALKRRAYVLRRMHELGHIDRASYEAALEAPLGASHHGYTVEVEAPFVGELVRAEMVARYGEDAAYTGGYKVITTIDSRLQPYAVRAVRNGVLEYSRRHGWQGPVAGVELTENPEPEVLDEWLAEHPPVGPLRAAVVLEVTGPEAETQRARVYLPEGERIIPWEGLAWVGGPEGGPAPQTAADILARGDIVYVEPRGDAEVWLAPVPEVEGALVALDPRDGAVVALTGGFDFGRSKFNRVTQAERQPGSAFKPFIYSAALEHGFTPATVVNDAPIVFEDPSLGEAWRPENYSGRVYGPTRLRMGLVNSRNLVSIRVLRETGIDEAIAHITRFGFPRDKLPRNLSLALGSLAVPPLTLARGYAVFANGGHLVEPYVIERIIGPEGGVLHEAESLFSCDDCYAMPEGLEPPRELRDVLAATQEPDAAAAPEPSPVLPVALAPRTVNAPNIYIMTDMLRDVVRRGTGARAMQLGRGDLAGKTGTSNDFRDAWFSGFNHALVTTVWIGYDQPRSLGYGEAGARAALPMWIDFMGPALEGVAELPLTQPPGIVSVRIDPETGLRVGAGHPGAVFEIFREGHLPPEQPESLSSEQGEDEEEGSLF